MTTGRRRKQSGRVGHEWGDVDVCHEDGGTHVWFVGSLALRLRARRTAIDPKLLSEAFRRLRGTGRRAMSPWHAALLAEAVHRDPTFWRRADELWMQEDSEVSGVDRLSAYASDNRLVPFSPEAEERAARIGHRRRAREWTALARVRPPLLSVGEARRGVPRQVRRRPRCELSGGRPKARSSSRGDPDLDEGDPEPATSARWCLFLGEQA